MTASLRQLLAQALQVADRAYAGEPHADLTPTRIPVLRCLADHGRVPQVFITEKTGIDRSTLGALVVNMKAAGLVEVERDESDNRANVVTITSAGKRALQSADHAMGNAERRILAGVPAKYRESGERFLAMIIQEGRT